MAIDTRVDLVHLFCERCGRITEHDVFEDEEQVGIDPRNSRRLWWAECLEDGGDHGHEFHLPSVTDHQPTEGDPHAHP